MFRNGVRSAWLKGVLAAFYAFMLLVPAWAGADDRSTHRPLDRIVVFGTSLSDPGNAYALSGTHLVLGDWTGMDLLTLTPESEFPYAIGGNRFSNGPTWIEQLAKPIGLAWSVKPAYVQSTDGSSNYAVGGARARSGVPHEVSLSDQLGRFLAGGQISRNALYVIEIGGNDVNDALIYVLNSGKDPREAVPEAVGAVFVPAVTSVAETIGALYQFAGARNFLIWNVPNLGLAPAVARVDAAYGAGGAIKFLATTLSGIYNDGAAPFPGLNGVLDGLSSALPGINIVRFDAFGTLGAVASNPSRYGLLNAADACIMLTAPYQCGTPNRYFFWDGIHPTRAGHAIVAIEAGKALIADLLAAH